MKVIGTSFAYLRIFRSLVAQRVMTNRQDERLRQSFEYGSAQGRRSPICHVLLLAQVVTMEVANHLSMQWET